MEKKLLKYNRFFYTDKKIKKILFKYQNIYFDLDHTLYNEYIYLKNSYKSFISKFDLDTNKNKIILDYMLTELINEKRQNIYRRTKYKFKLTKTKIEDFLYCLRNNHEQIYPFKGSFSLLKKLLDNKIYICLITNGNIIQQKNKIKLLKLTKIFNNNIIFTQGENKKPNPKLLLKSITKNLQVKENTLLIGDSYIDQELALNSGINFINIDSLFPKNFKYIK